MNDCKHRVKFKGDPVTVGRVFESIRGLPGTPNELLDLNAVVPMPDEIIETQELGHIDVVRDAVSDTHTFADYQRRKDAAQSAAWLATGFDHWGEWTTACWGTKHNVYDVERSEDEENTLYFSSGWTPVTPALVELSIEFPTITIEVSYADEGGYIIGKGTIKAGRKRMKSYKIRTPEGRQVFERFWGEWYGDEGMEDGDFIDLSHKAAS